jgi:hypothetical protein
MTQKSWRTNYEVVKKKPLDRLLKDWDHRITLLEEAITERAKDPFKSDAAGWLRYTKAYAIRCKKELASIISNYTEENKWKE